MSDSSDRKQLGTGNQTGRAWKTQAATGTEGTNRPQPTLDIHIHLFGTGDSGSGCRLSRVVTEGRAFQILANEMGLSHCDTTLDEGYALALADQLQRSNLQKGVILSQDAVYQSNGKPDWGKTHFYVPNDYLLQVVARFSRWMIPCVSINPQRADAIDELELCAAKGARVLKIHPPTQGVDLLDRRYSPFLRRCAQLNFVIMVHTGHEHTAPVIDAALANPRKLASALEEGCTVVACHCGTGWPSDPTDMLPDFLAMIRKYKNLWGDTSVLGSAGRVRDMTRLLANDEARDRLLHGSDFPFPAAPRAFAATVGEVEAAQLQAVDNLLERDFMLKDVLGVGRASAERAYRVICNDGGGA